jgi:hypothetical protein
VEYFFGPKAKRFQKIYKKIKILQKMIFYWRNILVAAIQLVQEAPWDILCDAIALKTFRMPW